MPKERPHESEDLGDYETLDSTDTLNGPPGDDPLDRGVVPPQRWSAKEDETLDGFLAAEEPDVIEELDDDPPGEYPWDENATEPEISRYAGGDVPDPRAGRLVSAYPDVYEEGDAHFVVRDAFVAGDEGIDGGGASAEEAAMHVVNDDFGQAGTA
ncbi:DUF5709 domain-containing protein [Nonomuraea fuscirosea]|uniref:DUF5709 domain-containing protein n=1 Tax=Nonomuraea fuscirosea TaxID=1291556 RepID=UPI003414DCE5